MNDGYAASGVDAICSSSTGVYLGFAGAFTAGARGVIKGRSQTRKNTQANATDSGTIIRSEIERMCSLVKPNRYQCINTNE
jgi:hypothetical protein